MNKPSHQMVPSQAARALFGQEAGTPGQGAPPSLVHAPGGALVEGLLHPSFSILERLYRVLPDEGWFSPAVSPTRPIQFELGSFLVPENQSLWLFDYEFTVFRPSGVDPGDFVAAAAGRFSNVMGFDVTISGSRASNLAYGLDPAPVSLTRQAFAAPPSPFGPTPTADFNRAAVNSFASTASPGTSLLPVRSTVQGPRDAPFTLVARQGSQVSLSCVIFNTVTAPIAAIQGQLAGYLLHTNLSESLLNRVRPR
jgi:hypothetical protein